MGLLSPSNQLPNMPADAPNELVLVVVARADRDWNDENYFLTVENGQLGLLWSETAPESALLGRVIWVLRPKRILDEDYNRELSQLEE